MRNLLHLKNWKAILAVLAAVVFCWSGAAAADVIYATQDSGYAASTFGIGTKDGSAYTVVPDILTGLGDPAVFAFTGADGGEKLLKRHFTYSPGDPVSIYDLEKDGWNAAPDFDDRAWNITDIMGVCTLGDYMYVGAYCSDFVSLSDQNSGEVVKIRLSDYAVVDRYKFPKKSGDNIYIQGIHAYGGKIYAVTGSPDLAYNWKNCEVYSFDPANIKNGPTNKVTAGINNRGGVLHNGTLFIACSNDNSYWAIDLAAMNSKKILDTSAVGDDALAKPGAIAFAADGAAMLLLSEGSKPKALYRTTAAKLLGSGADSEKAGEKVSAFSPDTSGYNVKAVYDGQNDMFWLANGVKLEAWGKDATRLGSFSPAELGNDQIYDITPIGKKTSAAGGGDNGSGGGCDAGLGALAGAMAAAAALKYLRRRG